MRPGASREPVLKCARSQGSRMGALQRKSEVTPLKHRLLKDGLRETGTWQKQQAEKEGWTPRGGAPGLLRGHALPGDGDGDGDVCACRPCRVLYGRPRVGHFTAGNN